MSKYPKKPHRGVWVDPNWGWRSPFEGVVVERAFDPIEDVPGYWKLEEAERRSLRAYESQARHIAAIVCNNHALAPESVKRYREAELGWLRASEIRDQVYEAYSGDYRL